ncbi:MAG: RNA polymerase sigma-70 factor [Saprospiraceae bacterium]|nr:RNA polymerase sigma-70 factor [Saprospiraceae bacterium]
MSNGIPAGKEGRVQQNPSKLKHQNEDNLVAALVQGNSAAFDTLFRQWYDPLCRYACRLAEGDMDEAEDLVQQAFVKLWETRAQLRVEWSLRAYLYKSVHHACLNRLRSKKVQSKYLEFTAQQPNAMHSMPDDTAPELRERYQRALDALPPQCRHIFELSRFEALKYREIADQLGISIKTVETQMGKALRVLRVELADYLVSLLACISLINLINPTNFIN